MIISSIMKSLLLQCLSEERAGRPDEEDRKRRPSSLSSLSSNCLLEVLPAHGGWNEPALHHVSSQAARRQHDHRGRLPRSVLVVERHYCERQSSDGVVGLRYVIYPLLCRHSPHSLTELFHFYFTLFHFSHFSHFSALKCDQPCYFFIYIGLIIDKPQLHIYLYWTNLITSLSIIKWHVLLFFSLCIPLTLTLFFSLRRLPDQRHSRAHLHCRRQHLEPRAHCHPR